MIHSQARPKTVIDEITGKKFTVFESHETTNDGAYIPPCISWVCDLTPSEKMPSWIEFVDSEENANGSIIVNAPISIASAGTSLISHLSARLAARIRRSLENIVEITINGFGTISAKTKKELEFYAGKIDIVMPVHGRGDWVRHCLKSIENCGGLGLGEKLIVVDDASDLRTKTIIAEYKSTMSGKMMVLRNENRLGYLASVNKGIEIIGSSGKGKLVVIMNSDVMVTPGWTEKIRRAFADESVGAASMISNNMVNLSVIPLCGTSYLRMNEMLEIIGREEYQDMVLPTGALLAFKRNLIEEYGLFDGKYYGEGYGEESDFLMWIRERAKKRIVMIDTGYFYHSGGASHPDRRNKEKAGYEKFIDRWGCEFKMALGNSQKSDPTDRIKRARDVFPKFKTRKICFYLHALELSGGCNVIANLANRMVRNGVDAMVCSSHGADHSHGLIETFFEPVIFKNEFDFMARFAEEVFSDGILVANIWFTAPWIKEICDKHKRIKPAYYIQDYDAWFNFSADKEAKVMETYGMIERKLCNAKWSAEMISQKTGAKIDVIPIGVDTMLFRPNDDWINESRKKPKDNPVKILGFYRPATPRRSPDDLLAIFHMLKQKYGDLIETSVFGDELNTTKERANLISHKGRVSQQNLSTILRDTDIFVDASKFQGFGLTNIEAMASGVAVVSSDNWGIHEYGEDEKSCMIFQPGDIAGAVEIISKLIDDSEKRIEITSNGMNYVRENLDWEMITEKMIRWFFGEE